MYLVIIDYGNQHEIDTENKIGKFCKFTMRVKHCIRAFDFSRAFVYLSDKLHNVETYSNSSYNS